MPDLQADPEIKYRYCEGNGYPRMKCKCGGVGDVAQIGNETGFIYGYVCHSCGKVLIHAHTCDTCKFNGQPHTAEFNDLRDEDGSQFLNLILEEIHPGHLAWINIHGCKTWRSKGRG